ncbi:MAG: cytochrome c nitrite reductase small subunit [Acidobacteria bacterium]|nr:cytochrome c nitrite reductase small subunit [Acidobacteriota bacterium]
MKTKALRITAFTLLGVLLGLGGITLHYAEGLSYLSTDPAACVHCHIMRPQYDAWQKASHHTAATCADCHLPAEFPVKYFVKAENGWSHSKGFTMQNFHEPIMIKPKNIEILQNNCLRCHADLLSAESFAYTEGAPRCVRCHDAVGHGEAAGLGGPMRTPAEELDGKMEER